MPHPGSRQTLAVSPFWGQGQGETPDWVRSSSAWWPASAARGPPRPSGGSFAVDPSTAIARAQRVTAAATRRAANPTRIVGGSGTVGPPGAVQPAVQPAGVATAVSAGRRRHIGFGGGGYYQPYPYSYGGYPSRGRSMFPALSSPYWFGGWPYSYPFGYGYTYPGWTAPYSVANYGPYARPYYHY